MQNKGGAGKRASVEIVFLRFQTPMPDVALAVLCA